MRLIRVLATTIFCVALFMIASNAISEEAKNVSLDIVFVNTILVMLFMVPYFLLAILILTVSNYILDRLGERRIWPYVLLWAVPALFIAYKSPIAVPFAASTGAIYWALTGRMAGKQGFFPKHILAQPFLIKLSAYAAGAYIVFIVAGWIFMGGKMLWVAPLEPPLGEPPFSTQFEREMTARMKIALMDFPDAQSCVGEDAGKVSPGILVPLDRGKIGSEEAAQVCIFRLLATYGDVSMSGEWFEGQGFRMSTGGFSAKRPNVNRDGTLGVHAYWLIREKGLLYKHRSFLIRVLNSAANAMAIYTRWSADGQTLLWVNSSIGSW